MLTIRGTRNLDRDIQQDNYMQLERHAGEFYREFTLPDHVDCNEIKAVHSNGVLTISVPKQETYMPRKIAVQEVH